MTQRIFGKRKRAGSGKVPEAAFARPAPVRKAHRVVVPATVIIEMEAPTPQEAAAYASALLSRQEDGSLVKLPFLDGHLEINTLEPMVTDSRVLRPAADAEEEAS